MTFTAGGSYSYSVPGGTLKGTINENGGSNVSETQTEKFTLTASGSWAQTGGSGSTSDSGSDVRSYQGGCSYGVEDHGVIVKGAVGEWGNESASYGYKTRSRYSGGAWQTSGTGGSLDKGHTMHTYAGSGSASSSASNGGDTSAYSASVGEVGSDHGDWDYKTKATYAGSGWSESGSGTASALMSATFVYNDNRVSVNTSSSSGPDGSSQSKGTFNESHEITNFRLSGSTEHYELVDGDWFMSSGSGATALADSYLYGVSSSWSTSSVGHSGNYSGGNGTYGDSWDRGSYDDNESEKTEQRWSDHTTAVPGGAVTTISTGSGGEEADGADDSTGYHGEQQYTRTSGSGQAAGSMSAFSYTSTAHNEYHDSSHWNHTDITVHSGSGSGATSGGGMSGSGAASGGSGSGVVASGSGSGSFAVSGYGTVAESDSWSNAGTGGGGHWTSNSSYSDSINYSGYSQEANVPAPGTSVFFGPAQPTWNDPGHPGELELGPEGGPVGGTNPGPAPEVAEKAPVMEAVVPQTSVTPGQFNAALNASISVAQGVVKTPSLPSPPAELAPLSAAIGAYAEQNMPVAKAPPLSEVENEPPSEAQPNPAAGAENLLALAETDDKKTRQGAVKTRGGALLILIRRSPEQKPESRPPR